MSGTSSRALSSASAMIKEMSPAARAMAARIAASHHQQQQHGGGGGKGGGNLLAGDLSGVMRGGSKKRFRE
jgi:hypothetical protein